MESAIESRQMRTEKHVELQYSRNNSCEIPISIDGAFRAWLVANPFISDISVTRSFVCVRI